MKKISEFLADIDPWGIYDNLAMREDFLKSTGKEPHWPAFSHKQTATMMQQRGLGGYMPNKEGRKTLCWGYEVARALASHYVPGFNSTKMGRGFAFNEAAEALAKAGL